MFEESPNIGPPEKSRARVRGIILAGAHSWDAQVLDDVMPRCLLPVALSPLICYTLQWLRGAGVVKTTICTDNVSRCARGVLSDGSRFNMDLDYFEDWVPRGAAGCVHDASMGTDADAYVVVQSTVIPNFPLMKLLATHFESRAALTVVLSGDRTEQGRDDALSPVGIYVFDRRAIDYIPEISYQDIKEILLPKLRDNNEPVIPFITRRSVARVTGVESYLTANERMVELACRAGANPGQYRRCGESLVHSSASVCDSASLIGPVLIGDGAHIAPGAAVVGPTAIGAGSRVKNGALVSRSVVWEDCEIGEGGLVFRSVLPGGAAVRAGARVRHCLLAPDRRIFPESRPDSDSPETGGAPISHGDLCDECNCPGSASTVVESRGSAANAKLG